MWFCRQNLKYVFEHGIILENITTAGEWNRENCRYLSENTLGITGNTNPAAVRGSHELLQVAQLRSVAGIVLCTASALYHSFGILQFR